MLNVVLVEPEIPPNTGSAGRLCLATGSRLHLVGPLGFSLDDRSLKRAGLDYWREVDLRRWRHLRQLQDQAAGDAQFHYFTTKAAGEHWSATYRDGDYLVFGCETRGLPEALLRENREHCRRIPTATVRSLNLATSVGIALYEALRQLRPPPDRTGIGSIVVEKH